MINLIPNEEKKIMIKDFYFRLATVVFLALSVITLIASISLLPAYFLSSAKKNIINDKLNTENTENIEKASEEALAIISLLDKNLSSLEKSNKDQFIISDKIIKQILKDKISGIKITQIFFENNKREGRKISIRGSAPSRERLVLFSNSLENDPLFEKVDLPISNFVQGSDIQFSLSLISF